MVRYEIVIIGGGPAGLAAAVAAKAAGAKKIFVNYDFLNANKAAKCNVSISLKPEAKK